MINIQVSHLVSTRLPLYSRNLMFSNEPESKSKIGISMQVRYFIIRASCAQPETRNNSLRRYPYLTIL